tara:strand:- start:76 stop:528 length:453 start_codon:yes stop_codon:yes gene_type:complete
MATTIKNATLKVTIKEEITLNGSRQDSENILRVSDINEMQKRILTVEDATNGTVIYGGASTKGAGQFISSNVKYIRVTNLDDTNFILLHLEGNSHYAQFKLEAGKSFMLGTPVGFDNNADIDNFSSETITNITAKADTADVDVEIVVAAA